MAGELASLDRAIASVGCGRRRLRRGGQPEREARRDTGSRAARRHARAARQSERDGGAAARARDRVGARGDAAPLHEPRRAGGRTRPARDRGGRSGAATDGPVARDGSRIGGAAGVGAGGAIRRARSVRREDGPRRPEPPQQREPDPGIPPPPRHRRRTHRGDGRARAGESAAGPADRRRPAGVRAGRAPDPIPAPPPTFALVVDDVIEGARPEAVEREDPPRRRAVRDLPPRLQPGRPHEPLLEPRAQRHPAHGRHVRQDRDPARQGAGHVTVASRSTTRAPGCRRRSRRSCSTLSCALRVTARAWASGSRRYSGWRRATEARPAFDRSPRAGPSSGSSWRSPRTRPRPQAEWGRRRGG